jgi:hypothetical protein
MDLSHCKELARSRDEAVRATAQIVVCGKCFEVSDKGSGLFPYVIRDHRFYIKISRPGNCALPMASGQIRNSHLLHAGPVQATQELRDTLEALGIVSGLETVSRVDLAVDFVSDAKMDGWGREAWVTRLEYKQAHSVGDHFTGWSIGRKSSLQFGLYDKTFEILHESGKDYLYEIWEKAGWVPWDSVWRAEGRFRRLILSEFGLNTLDDVLRSLPGLWAYLTNTSLRLTIPNESDSTRARWPNHAFWDALAGVQWNRPFSKLSREYKDLNAPSDRILAIRTIACLTSVMGRDAILEPGAAWDWLRAVSMSYLRGRESITGKTPEDALIERAQDKARRYGTMLNVGGRPALPLASDPAAQAYRQASDGV